MHKLNGTKQLTDNKFLNLFELNMTNEKTNKDYKYFVASRKKEEELVARTRDHSKADAVMILCVQGHKIFLIKQFRPAINDYILESPAGLVDEGETVESAISREVFEEIGLTVKEVMPFAPISYTSEGMSDESVAIYIAECEGTPSTENNQENEDIEIVEITPDNLPELLNGDFGMISIKTFLSVQLLLQQAIMTDMEYTINLLRELQGE